MANEPNDEKPPLTITKGWVISAMLCLSPIFFLSIYLGHVKEGLGAWACAGIVTIAVRARWDLRDHAWFWMIAVFAILLQAPFVLLFPWTNRNLSYVGLLPVGVLDYAIVYACIKLGEKVMRKRNL